MQATINLLPKQSEAWELFENPVITELGYGGAAGGGKTRLGWYLAIAISEMYPGARGVVGRKELKNFKVTTLTELWEIFKELGYKKGNDYSYNDQKSILTFPNGSEILFKDTAYSPQDPEYTSLGGLPLTWAWLDESNETPEKAKSILKTRVGRLNYFQDGYCVSNVVKDKEFTNIKPFWFESFNPNKNHVYRDYYKPWKDGTMPEYRAFVRALPGDNPHLSESYLDNLRRSDKVTRMRLLDGNFEYDDDPSTMMAYNNIVDIFTNTIQKRDDKYISVDVARLGKDTTVIMLWEDLEVIKIDVLEKTTLDVTAEKIKAIASENRVPFSHIIIDEDGVGGGIVDMLGGVVGFVANSVPRKIDTGIKDERPLNYSNLKSQCYFTLANYVNKHRLAVQIHDIIIREKIVEELEQIKQKDIDKDGKLTIIPKDKMKEALGRSPDFADALMMRMYFELGKAMNVGIHIPRHNINRRTITTTI